MPPTPSPAPPSPGHCVVCGKEMWMRCSACSEHGLDWMCFCSREHQKLIWFMHKRVCRRNSNPFRWPKFNDDEIADIKSFATKPFRPDDPQETTCLMESVGESVWPNCGEPFPEKAFTALLKMLKDRKGAKYPVPELPQTEEVIFLIRSLSHGARYRHLHYADPGTPCVLYVFEAINRSPIDAMASKIVDLIGDFADDPKPAWYARHLHLYMILIAIEHHHFTKSGGTDKATASYVLRASKQLETFYLNVVAKTHPREAQTLINDLMFNKHSGKRGLSGNELWPSKKVPQVGRS